MKIGFRVRGNPLNDILQYTLLGGLACALLYAAFTDIKSRTISNVLNAGIALAAPAFWWASGVDLWPGVAMHIGVALATFAVTAGLFAIRMMGGGDVKLLTALALWIEPTWFLQLVIIMALAGGVLTIVMGVYHFMKRQREKLAVPYGVAIAFAGLWVLSIHYLPSVGATNVTG